MPKVVQGKVTEGDINHPLYFLTEKDSYLFALGKEKGLSDELMGAMSVIAIANVPVQNGETMNISSEEELELAATQADPLVYDKEKKRLVVFYPTSKYIQEHMKESKANWKTEITIENLDENNPLGVLPNND